MQNPWDRPPWPQQGEDEPEPIYLAVGHALSQWADVEKVFQIFLFFSLGRNKKRSLLPYVPTPRSTE
jgi:hypothetical protein